MQCYSTAHRSTSNQSTSSSSSWWQHQQQESNRWCRSFERCIVQTYWSNIERVAQHLTKATLWGPLLQINSKYISQPPVYLLLFVPSQCCLDDAAPVLHRRSPRRDTLIGEVVSRHSCDKKCLLTNCQETGRRLQILHLDATLRTSNTAPRCYSADLYYSTLVLLLVLQMIGLSLVFLNLVQWFLHYLSPVIWPACHSHAPSSDIFSRKWTPIWDCTPKRARLRHISQDF